MRVGISAFRPLMARSHLDGGKLERLLLAAEPGATARCAYAGPRFVELIAPAQTTNSVECLIEFELPAGRSRKPFRSLH